MTNIIRFVQTIFNKLDWLGLLVSMLVLRLFLAYEFAEAGLGKLNGDNWFAHVKDDFPFPFNVIPTDISWFLATWSEVLGAAALVIGLGTRFAAVSLLILDIVAWVSVHGGNGYNVCDNGYKLPLIYLIMLVPLIFTGPGKLSVDHWLKRKYFN